MKKNDEKLLLPGGHMSYLRTCIVGIHRIPVSRKPAHHFALQKKIATIGICIGFFASVSVSAQSTVELKKLSVEELMNIEVTSVSKAPEKLTEVASAIQV